MYPKRTSQVLTHINCRGKSAALQGIVTELELGLASEACCARDTCKGSLCLKYGTVRRVVAYNGGQLEGLALEMGAIRRFGAYNGGNLEVWWAIWRVCICVLLVRVSCGGVGSLAHNILTSHCGFVFLTHCRSELYIRKWSMRHRPCSSVTGLPTPIPSSPGKTRNFPRR